MCKVCSLLFGVWQKPNRSWLASSPPSQSSRDGFGAQICGWLSCGAGRLFMGSDTETCICTSSWVVLEQMCSLQAVTVQFSVIQLIRGRIQPFGKINWSFEGTVVFNSTGFLSCYSMVVGNVKSQGQGLNKKGSTVLRYCQPPRSIRRWICHPKGRLPWNHRVASWGVKARRGEFGSPLSVSTAIPRPGGSLFFNLSKPQSLHLKNPKVLRSI